MNSLNSKSKKKKIIFIFPPKKWFYGIDYKISEGLVEYFEKKNIFKIYRFYDIEIFLKKDLNFFDYLKIFKMFIYFKLRKIDYVFAFNSNYILYSNIRYKKKILNFFSNLLNIKCVLRWDHINEQLPNIVEHVCFKYNLLSSDDYRDFFFKHLNSDNFLHFTWQNSSYFTDKNLFLNFKKLYNVNFNNLSFIFHNEPSDHNSVIENKVILSGYLKNIEEIDNNTNLYNLIKDKENFYKKKFFKSLINITDYNYNKKKNDLVKNKQIYFYGIDSKNNKFQIQNENIFFKNLGKYFMVINPSNFVSSTVTLKFYLIFLNKGFCLNEMPENIPPKLKNYENYVFYKDTKDLIDKINMYKKNNELYKSIKNNLYKISKELHEEELLNFKNQFLK